MIGNFLISDFRLYRAFMRENMDKSGKNYIYRKYKLNPALLLELIASVTRSGYHEFFMSNLSIAEFFGLGKSDTVRLPKEALLKTGWVYDTGNRTDKNVAILKLTEKSLKIIDNYKCYDLTPMGTI